MNTRTSDPKGPRRFAYHVSLLALLTVAAAAMHAQVVITGGNVGVGATTQSPYYCNLNSLSGANFALTGTRLLGMLTPSIFKPSGQYTTVIFNPNLVETPGEANGYGVVPQRLIYNGVTYDDNVPYVSNSSPNYIVTTMNFTGPTVSAPDILPGNFSSGSSASVSNVPFAMTGTITVHTGSSTGPVILTVPISGSGLYSSTQQIHPGSGGDLPLTGTTYQFLPPSTTMFGLDPYTQGAWIGKYGTDGYMLPNGASNLPSYAAVSVTNAQLFGWAYQSTDSRALQIAPGSALGNANVYTQYPNTSFTINVNLTDRKPHRVALYLLDWDSYTRVEKITIRDAVTNAVLDEETLSNFHDGQYVTWNLQGNVTISVTPVAGSPAVSGIFFDPPAASTAQPGFTLSATPVTIVNNGTATSTITVTPSNGFNSPVTLDASTWNAAGYSGIFATNPTTGTSTVTVNSSTFQAAGTYPLTVTGTSGSLTASTTIQVTVLPVTLSATPLTLQAGGVAASSTITINNNNFPCLIGAVTPPAGINLISRINNSPYATSAVLSFQALSTVAAGQYAIPVGFNCSTSTITTSIPVTVTPATTTPGFVLAVAPATTQAGTYVTSGVQIVPTGGFNSPVTLQAVNWPAHVIPYFVTNGNTGLTNLTISTDAAVTPGSYSLTIKGTGGSFTTTTTVALTITSPIPGFTVGAVVTTIAAGATGTTTFVTNPFIVGLDQLSSTTPAWPTGITHGCVCAQDPSQPLVFSTAISVAASVAPGTYSLPITFSGSLNANTTISLTVTGGSAPGPSATYVTTDANTQGVWNGKYGADGFLIANLPPSIPSYASVSVTGATTYTWAGATSDPRAPQSGKGSTVGYASSYSAPSTFNINVNLTDGNTHRVGLYLLDWDTTTRMENVVVLDAATNAAIDQKTFPSFNSGLWAVWDIKGNVIFKVTSTNPNANAVFSGIFFGPVSTAPQLTATPASVPAGSQVDTSVTVQGLPNSASVTPLNWPAGISINTLATIIGSPNSPVAVPISVQPTVAPGTYVLNLVANSGFQTVTGTLSLTVTTGVLAFNIPDVTGANPGSFASVTINVTQGYIGGLAFAASGWPAGITLNPPSYGWVGIFHNGILSTGSDIQVASNVAPGTYTLTLLGTNGPLSASTTFKLSVVARPAPSFTLYSDSSPVVKAGSTATTNVFVNGLNGFNSAVTLAAAGWPAGITGSFATNPTTTSSVVTISVPSSVAPGSYSLPVSGTSGSLSASTTIALTVTAAAPPTFGFTGLDTTTQGAWTGKYGSAGRLIPNGTQQNPSYGFASVSGATTYTWAYQTTDPRALQSAPGSATGFASTYTQYPNNAFSINVSLNDGAIHKFALYLLDWDSTSRTETITLTDALTGAVLDTQTITNFHNGTYAVWNVKGNFVVKITPAPGTTSALSGIFFD